MLWSSHSLLPHTTHIHTSKDLRTWEAVGEGKRATGPQDMSAVIFIQWCSSFDYISLILLCIPPLPPEFCIHKRRVLPAKLLGTSWYSANFIVFFIFIFLCRLLSSAFGGFVCSILYGFLGDWKVLSSNIWLWRRSDIAAFCVNTAGPQHVAVLHRMQSNKNGKNLWFSFLSTWVFFPSFFLSRPFFLLFLSCVSPRLQCTALFSYLLWTTLTLPETQPIGCSFRGSPIQPFGKIRSMWAMCQN